MMFSENHKIWKEAQPYARPETLLEYAQELIEAWSRQESDEVVFITDTEIEIAIILLEDNLLPASARIALARVMLKAVYECKEKKYKVESLKIKSSKRGAKSKLAEQMGVVSEVYRLRDKVKTMTLPEAFEIVGDKYHKSPDTIEGYYNDHQRLRKGKPVKYKG